MYAIYGSKIVTLAGRESTYTLDEIVHNPLLEIERHTTDTYGSTDMLFALFDLIGKSFHPRIRDLQSHVDYRLGPGQPDSRSTSRCYASVRAPRDHHRALGGDAARRRITDPRLGHPEHADQPAASTAATEPARRGADRVRADPAHQPRAPVARRPAPAPRRRRDAQQGREGHDLRQHSASAAKAKPTPQAASSTSSPRSACAGHERITSWSARYRPRSSTGSNARASGQRDRPGAHLRGALRARQPARPLPIHPRGPADGRLRRLRPANPGKRARCQSRNRSFPASPEPTATNTNRCPATLGRSTRGDRADLDARPSGAAAT